ncbi:MAG TPA: aldo/keto reductase, partial [Acidiphilium sp.]
MSQTAPPLAAASGRFTFPGTGIGVNRMGYGAMQLAGPHVFGPPKDETAAIAVLREAVKLGVDHVDTSDFYGPHVTNRIIRTALYPYTGVTLVTKLGARRDDAGNWLPDLGPDGLTRGIEDNLRNLDVGHIDIVNLRIMDPDSDIAGPVATMRRL